MRERLQKIIASAGIASRRKAEKLIAEGQVSINGHVVREMGLQADPEQDCIRVRGRLMRPKPAPIYLLLYKPRGCVSTLSDPHDRPTVRQIVKKIRQRIFPVGRLDYDTEGLLLLTTDGALAHILMHPRHGVSKIYQVKVKGVLPDSDIRKLEKGILLSGRKTAPCRIGKLRKTQQNSWLEVTLHEGRKHQIRRMLEKVGHPVLKLKRTGYDFLRITGLKPGHYRHLTPLEIKKLQTRGRSVPVRRGQKD